MNPLQVRQLVLGPMANFVYLLAEASSKQALVVDPAWDVPAMRTVLDKEGWILSGVFLTHHHFDHINGLGEILQWKDVPVYMHQQDAGVLRGGFASNLKLVAGGERINLGALELTVLHTPGHTEGSLCLQIADHLLTGDTLFIRGCGRVDLPNSDPEKMFATLKKIASLDDRVLVLPGHHYGPTPTAALGDERKQNPFLKMAQSAPLHRFLEMVV